MYDLLTAISKADDYVIGEILKAVLDRYAVLFPSWEVHAISLDKTEDRNEQLDRMIQVLENMKTSSD